MSERKTYRARVEFKADADKTGEFRAEFATLNVIDHDRDVTEPGAFQDGQETLIEAWNHNYGVLPVGKGIIRENDDKAIIEGAFFMETQGGLEHYKVVKALGPLQEWSYTFNIEDSARGQFEDQEVQFLRKLDVWGVAPVQRGAGIDTRTVDIKGRKPYPNEHACRLRDPGDFQSESFRRVSREHDGKTYGVIMGRLTDETTMTEQAYRYPKDDWTAAEARTHCRSHDGTFEAATEAEKSLNLSKLIETIITAFETEFNPKGPDMDYGEWAWVREVYDDHLLVNWKHEAYQVNYRLDDGGNYVFTSRPEWIRGAYIFVAGAKAAHPLHRIKAATAKGLDMLRAYLEAFGELGGGSGEIEDEAGDGKSREKPGVMATRIALDMVEYGL